MKLVFDDGTEQEMVQEDFYGILIRAEQKAEERELVCRNNVKEAMANSDYKLSMHYMKMADREKSLNTICNTVESLYFN